MDHSGISIVYNVGFNTVKTKDKTWLLNYKHSILNVQIIWLNLVIAKKL